MKNVIIFLVLFIVYSTQGQVLALKNIDRSDFPRIKASVLCTDLSGKTLSGLTAADFRLLENGKESKILAVSNGAQFSPQPLSGALIIDASRSMDDGKTALARAAANLWLEIMPETSECAITAFDYRSYTILDLTSNINKLKTKVNELFQGYGSYYKLAFSDKRNNAYDILKSAKNKKVIILISDGFHENDSSFIEILKQAENEKVAFFTIVLGARCSESFKYLANLTDGMYFENVTNQEQVNDAVRAIVLLAQGEQFGTMEWETDFNCTRDVDVELTCLKTQASCKDDYFKTYNNIGRLEFDPPVVRFRNIPAGVMQDTTVTVTAYNTAFKINSISSSNGHFSLSEKSFTLQPGKSMQLKLRYSPTDDSYQYSVFNFDNGLCTVEYEAWGLKEDSGKYRTNLRIVSPNGGEEINAGRETLVRWEGIAPSEPVRLEFSTDNGSAWKTIAKAVTGNRYTWKVDGNLSGNSCLLRVSQENGSSFFSDLMLSIRFRTGFTKIKFSPDSRQIAAYGHKDLSNDNLLFIDVNTGTSLANYRSLFTTDVSFCPDSKYFAACGFNSALFLGEQQTGRMLRQFLYSKGRCNSVSFSPDGKELASLTFDSLLILWDFVTGKKINSLSHPCKTDYNNVEFSPDGKRLSIPGQKANTTDIIDVATFKTICTIPGTTYENRFAFSPDSRYFAINNSSSNVTLWEIETGKMVESFSPESFECSYLYYTPDGNEIVCANSKKIIIIDALNGNTKRLFKNVPYFSFTAVSLSPDGEKIATINERTPDLIEIWDYKTGLLIKTIYISTNEFNKVKVYDEHDCFVTSGVLSVYCLSTMNFLRHVLISNAMRMIPDDLPIITDNPDSLFFLIPNEQEQKLQYYDLLSGTCSRKLNLPISNSCYKSVFPDNKTLAYKFSSENQVTIYDIENDKSIKKIKNNDFPASSPFVITPDGKNLIFEKEFDSNNNLLLFNLADSAFITKYSGHRKGLTNFDFTPDCKYFVTASYDTTVKIWDYNSGSEIRTLTGFECPVEAISISNDGNILATNPFRSTLIQLWDLKTGTIMSTIDNKDNYLDVLDISSSGKYLASGSFYNVNIWNLEDNRVKTDISDAVLAIRQAPVETKNVDLGKVSINTVKDSLVKELIVNSSSKKIRIEYICIDSAYISPFSVAPGILPAELGPGTSLSVDVCFKPKGLGTFTALLLIITEADTIRKSITAECVNPDLASPVELVDFGTVPAGSAKDTTLLLLKNITANPIEVSSIAVQYPNTDQYELLSSNHFTLQPYEKSNITLRFKPNSAGRISGRLLVYYQGSTSPLIIHLFGYGNGDNLGIDEGINNKSGIQSSRIVFICPNPSSESVEIGLNLLEAGTSRLFITDILGKEVKQLFNSSVNEFGTRTITADISGLPAGVYFVVLQTPTVRSSMIWIKR